MKHSRSKWFKVVVILIACHLSPFTSIARPYLNDLNIRVVLNHNGDARITEVRRMQIDSEGTECYIGLGNMGGSQILDLQVSDETGRLFDNIGGWDINQSRSWKEGRCGIVNKRDGYELCWGLGDNGNRTYTTSYTITSLVRAYSDADAIRHVFLDQDVTPKPYHFKLTIVPCDSLYFTRENTAVWGFRFRGEINLVGDSIVAESTEPMESRSAAYIMVRFDKGMFEPTLSENDTFEHKKEQALEGSDYNSDDSDFWPAIVMGVMLLLGGGFFLGLYLLYVWWQRRKVNKNLMWYRDIPLKGNLQRANDILNAYKYGSADYNNLLSACILKLIDMGAIKIESRLNAKGKTEQNFVIKELPNIDKQPKLLKMVHNIFKSAAGSDTILEPRELKSWMKSSYNQSYTDSFIQTLHTKTSIYQYKNQLDEVRQLFGLKKFLKEFSLLDERHVQEVALWKDYMIYATLFGIADQVIKDMKKINPEYFNMDRVAQQMADDMTLPMIYSTMHSSTTRAAMSKAEREARASGGGGSTSWGGGGGGFSGGGFGGGVR